MSPRNCFGARLPVDARVNRTDMHVSMSEPADHFDVLIVGAGLSGIGAAWHLQHRLPGKSYAILEARDAIGGTWDLFRYPGIRSDSDMFTLGYRFKPWTAPKSIADGADIRDYIVETARENGIAPHIRFSHRVERVAWSSSDARWTVTADVAGELRRFTCAFLFMCSGYYRYDRGYTPDFAGLSDFAGQVVHPQHWPEDLDLTNKRVVVIGSGATAVTLIPSIASKAAHVTMLQRSPTYIASLPAIDAFAGRVRKLLPKGAAYSVTRGKKIGMSMFQYGMIRRHPAKARAFLTDEVRKAVGPDIDVAMHFTPRYDPWDQRLCLAPDGDFFATLREGRASVVTDTVARFTPAGIVLDSGAQLDADVVVTATGLELQMFGGAEVVVDGVPLSASDTMVYRGMMVGGVPNLAVILGYNNASWTLKADLSADFACRLIARMDKRGQRIATPVLDRSQMTDGNFFGLTSNYLTRAATTIPRQGARAPWRMEQNYARDLMQLRFGRIDDGVLAFS